MHQYPQKIAHVRDVPATQSLDEITGLVEQIKKSKARLAKSGPQFINVRYSGTEKRAGEDFCSIEKTHQRR